MAPGEYQGQITISDSNAVNSPKYVGVNLTVIGPSLGVNQNVYSFTASKETLNKIRAIDGILSVRVLPIIEA